MHVSVDTTNTDRLGKTYCTKMQSGNCLVATEVNLDEYWSEVYKHLKRFN